MIGVYTFFMVVLAVSLFLGLVRVMRGPTAADRMLAAQLLGTTGIGLLALFAAVFSQPALIDVALVFALLAAITTVTFVRRHPVEFAKGNR